MMDSNKYLGSEDAAVLCCLKCLTVFIPHEYLPFPFGHSVNCEARTLNSLAEMTLKRKQPAKQNHITVYSKGCIYSCIVKSNRLTNT
jgi:hypothetical protein